MKGVFLDTSVLVSSVVEELPQHASAHCRFVQETSGAHAVYCSTHTLAECYATLTELPLKRRVSGVEASHLIRVNFIGKPNVVDLDHQDYGDAIAVCASKGRVSGQIYDALHLVAARKAGCCQLLTYNLGHFRSLNQWEISISAP